jgi:hypothetical protein
MTFLLICVGEEMRGYAGQDTDKVTYLVNAPKKLLGEKLPCVSLEIVRMNTQNALISVSPRERLDVLTAA